MSDNQKIIPITGAGGGKGGGSSRTPKEAPNTLRSIQYAELLDVISVGPCEGLVDGAKSIYLDDVPIQNPDGSYNFDGVAWQHREGYPSQAPVSGFPAIENTQAVNIEITSATSPIQSVTDLNADSVRVTLRVPRLTKQNLKNGDTNGYEVTHAIDVKADGDIWRTPHIDTIKGKCTVDYQRAYRVRLTGTGPWQIRVRRTSPDSTGSNIVDRVWWDTMTTIIDQRMTYPDTAYVALRADAKQFGGKIPSRSYKYRGIIVDIPSNYDPYTRTYTGDWDGTFTKGWTNNPAWIFYALATNSEWGAGMGSVDRWLLYRIGKYCDELVPDGYGGQEPRYTINTVLTKKEDVHKVLTSLASVFRAMVYYGTSNDTGSVIPVADMPKDVIATFGAANVIDGVFEYQDASERVRYNRIKVKYNDPDNKFKPATEVVDDNDSLRFGIKEKEITAFGCSSRGQARRLGLWEMYTAAHETETVSFGVGNHYADLRPGDIIAVNDPDLQGVRLFGRLSQTGTDTLVLDDLPPWDEGQNWRITVTLPDGQNQTATIANYQDTIVTLDTPLSDTPVDNATYLLSADNLEPRLYRVLSSDEQDNHTFAITALEYWPQKFAAIDHGVEFEESFKDLIPTGRVSPPLSINIETHTVLDGGVNRQMLTVGWTASDDPRIVGYYVSHQGPDDYDFNDPIYTTGYTHTFKNVFEGEHTIKVIAVDSLGDQSLPVQQSTTINNLLEPVNISNIDYDVGNYEIRLTPRATRDQQYQFWRSLTALQTGDIESNAINLGTMSVLVDTRLTPNTTYYYYVRAVNAYGFSDWYPINLTTTKDPSTIIDVISGEIRKTDLYTDLISDIDRGVNADQALITVDQRVSGLEGQYTVKIDNNNAVTGFGLAIDDNNQSLFAVNADRFAIFNTNSASTTMPFIVDGNETYMDAAFIKKLDAGKITSVTGNFTEILIGDGEIGMAKITDILKSDDFVSGASGWQLNKNGTSELNNTVIRGSAEITSGTLDPNIVVDGDTLAAIKASGIDAKNTVDGWVRPGTTLINGNKIYTGDAYVDTLQIKGQAVTFLRGVSTTGSIGGSGTSWTTAQTLNFNHTGAPLALWLGFEYGGSTTGQRIEFRIRIVSTAGDILVPDRLIAAANPQDVEFGLSLAIVGGYHAASFYIPSRAPITGVRFQFRFTALNYQGGSGSVTKPSFMLLEAKR
ncbi:host specificity protein J [Marinobacter sp. W-8]|uniref:host specificity protein J n=1 Tax=Marinobacter sp. W-8 TaxID=3369658 RepID=UPI0037CB37A4